MLILRLSMSALVVTEVAVDVRACEASLLRMTYIFIKVPDVYTRALKSLLALSPPSMALAHTTRQGKGGGKAFYAPHATLC